MVNVPLFQLQKVGKYLTGGGYGMFKKHRPDIRGVTAKNHE